MSRTLPLFVGLKSTKYPSNVDEKGLFSWNARASAAKCKENNEEFSGFSGADPDGLYPHGQLKTPGGGKWQPG
jgi:hypothetical protein